MHVGTRQNRASTARRFPPKTGLQTMRQSIRAALVTSAVLLSAPWVSAQEANDGSSLSGILQGLQWRASTAEVLEHYQALYLEDYRAEISGMRDPLLIDSVRRAHDQRYERVEQSLESFDGARTGYEVSVLGGEVVAGHNESMLTVRTDNAMLYYLFTADQLYKVVVAYNSSYLGGLEFESFLDQVERRYGPPIASEVDETATGIRYLARAKWEDGDTRLRVENRSNLFGTFVMVFTDLALEDTVTAARGAGRTDSAVAVSERVRQLSQERGGGAGTDIADQIIGAPTVVELTVPEADPLEIATPEEAQPIAEMSEEEEAELAAQQERERQAQEERRRRRARERQEREEQAEEEGITIY